MIDNEFKTLLLVVWEILKEAEVVSIEKLFEQVNKRLSADRESIAFVLGWLAKANRVSIRKENEDYMVYETNCFGFAFG